MPITANLAVRLNRYSVLLLLLVGSLLPAPGFGADPPSPQAFEGIDCDLASGQARQAWEDLVALRDEYGPQAEILWRMARSQYELGRVAKEGEVAGHLRQAETLARAAIATDPKNAEGYKWLAIALGAEADKADTGTQVELSREIKENIDKAIALDPDDDISYLVLSRWHYKISRLGFFARTIARIVYGGLPKASMADAEKYLLRAIALHDRIAHRYNLAKVYEKMGKPKLAVAQLEKALKLPVSFPEEAEDVVKAERKLEILR